MLVAKKQLRAAPLKIATGKIDLPEKKPALYKVKSGQKLLTLKKDDPDPLPFDKWNMPPQEEGYIKCRDFDFL